MITIQLQWLSLWAVLCFLFSCNKFSPARYHHGGLACIVISEVTSVRKYNSWSFPPATPISQRPPVSLPDLVNAQHLFLCYINGRSSLFTRSGHQYCSLSQLLTSKYVFIPAIFSLEAICSQINFIAFEVHAFVMSLKRILIFILRPDR